MDSFPAEHELLALFECEPVLRDSQSKNLPFYYHEATYRFSNEEEDFLIVISPAYGEVKIQVNHRLTQRLISRLDMKRVKTFEVVADKKNFSRVFLAMANEDELQTLEIEFKPYFKLILQDHLEF